MNNKVNKDNLSIVSNEEKQQLKKRIFLSIAQLKRRRRIQYLSGVAASIILIICFGIYSYNKSQNPSIADFAHSSKKIDFNNSDKVTIILNEGKDIRLDGETTSITYSKKGDKFNVDNNTYSQSKVMNGELKYNTIIVPYGKRSMVTLSDGSKVWLNSGSRLIYPIVFNANKREVYLEGEAIFEVTHHAAHPFSVLTENQEIEDLGTVFNVSSYSDDENNFVVLKSGSVQITYKENSSFKKKRKTIIAPGAMANINLKSNKISSQEVNVNQYFSWKQGVLILQNNNLSYITKRLSRYYNVNIVIEDESLANETFTGYLDLKDDVEKVIQTIKQTSNLKYQKIENKIILTKK